MKAFHSPLDPGSFSALLACLHAEHVGLFPTDTVYGIGCRADSEEGTNRIFEIKGRDFAKTLPILIGDWEQFEEFAEPIGSDYMDRLREVWPGGLTAVVRASMKGQRLSQDCLREGTLAIRMPDHEELRNLIREIGAPLAATSANLSGEIEHLRLSEISKKIRSLVDWEWDEPIEQTEVQPSTVVDLTGKTPVVLRQGGVVF
ncbi:MAG: threonylcarbamoyl-AMP synthase [Candidatus Omnitrophica bacterium]|nr:threonylcarbamoyl-AMP synthase [Candidatus Omnitrophota bacterium]